MLRIFFKNLCNPREINPLTLIFLGSATGAHPGELRALTVRKHFSVPPLRSRPATRHDNTLIFSKVFNFEFRIFNFELSRSFAINPRTLDHPRALVN